MPPKAPVVNFNQPANSGCVSCHQAVEHPCDVDSLTVKVEYETKDGKQVKTFTADGRKRKAIVTVPVGKWDCRTHHQATRTVLPYPTLSWQINDMLQRYDFVIEALADHPVAKTVAEIPSVLSGANETSAKKKAKITAKAKFTGLKCERYEHGLIRLKHRKESVSTKVNQANHEFPPLEVAAVPYPLLDGPNSGKKGNQDGKDLGGILFIFEFLGAVFASMTPREVEIIAQGCGRRAKGDAKPGAADLRGLVRVYRKDTWTVGLKIPALGEFKQEASGKKQLLTGQTEGKFEQEGRFATTSSKSSSKTTSQGGTVTTERERENWQGGQGSSFKSTNKTQGEYKELSSESQYSGRDGSKMKYSEYGAIKGIPIREQVSERLKHKSGFDLVLARNGTEVPIKEQLEKLKKAVEAFGKVLGGIQQAFKKAPQVGWKFTFEISALAGSIVLEFTPKPSPALADGRYQPVNYTCKGKIELEVVNLKIALSFGVEATALDSGLVLKIEGSIKLEVKVNFEVDADSIKKPVQEIGIEGKYTGEIKIVGYVSLVGKTVADAQLSIEAGFEFKDGKLVIDLSKRQLKLKGELRTKPITLSGKIVCPYWFDKKIDPPKELLPGVSLHKFG